MALIEDLMPAWDVRKRYERLVRAPAGRTWAALQRYDISHDSSALTKALLRLRGLRPEAGTGVGAFAGSRFSVVGERPGAELVVAIAGKFWAIRESNALEPVEDAAHISAYDVPGRAVAVWSFEVAPRNGRSVLATETRVRCTDDRARRIFKAYWTVIEPFSGMIRRDMLRTVAQMAEGR